jgi:2-polyprenyl-3-methyl-5-hydroxy-6-metoxy-1,4-benzoquinol methylase
MMEEKEILEAIARYKFYHNIRLTDTITTPGWADAVPAQNLCLKHLESMNLKGKRVLDIGCRDGLFSFKAESMGADEVVGIDNDLSKPATEFIIPFLHSKVKMQQVNLYDLDPKIFGIFDIVIFAGVLYHLRYPFWGLKLIRDIINVGGHLLIETAIWQGEPDKAMLFCPIGNEGPYFPDTTSCTFFNEKGLVDTMKSLGFETMRIEYLTNSTENRAGGQPIKRRVEQKTKQVIKDVLQKKGFTKSSKFATDRCVFQLVYRGDDQDSNVLVNPADEWADVQFNTKKYWEKTHDIHTKYG